MTTPISRFEPAIYADATLAGLAVLVPVPLLDSLFESHFRRRMVRRIARERGRSLPAAVLREIDRAPDAVWWRSCLLLALTAVPRLLVRLSRKLLYFITINEAADRLSYYWHRAFLIDHMLRAGHLDSLDRARLARQALHEALAEVETSPLQQLARRAVTGARGVTRALRRAWRDRSSADRVAGPAEAVLAAEWAGLAGYLASVAARYEGHYGRLPDQNAEAAAGDQ